MQKLWILAVLLVGCGGAIDVIDSDGTTATDWYIRPVRADGEQLGLAGTSMDLRAKRNQFRYHGGAVMTSTTRVYLIWYGSWNDPSERAVLTDLVQNLGGSDYWAINTRFADGSGANVPNSVQYTGTYDDAYSQGPYLNDTSVDAVVATAITSGALTADPNGVYFVLPSIDVDATQSGICTSTCGLHHLTTVNGVQIKYALIANPGRCPTACAVQPTGPNGHAAADAMASLLAAQLTNTVADPTFDAFYDRRGLEPADKCAWTYGTTYTTANGSEANVSLGGRDYLLQQLWVRLPGSEGNELGTCALSL